MSKRKREEFNDQDYVKKLLGGEPPKLEGLEAKAVENLQALVVRMGQAQAGVDNTERQIRVSQANLEQGVAELRRMQGEFGALSKLLCDAEAERQGFTVRSVAPNQDGPLN